MVRIKYPRTPHLESSPGLSQDDILVEDNAIYSKNVIVTEKLDGECTAMYHDYFHARSINSSDHESQHYVKAIWNTIKSYIPEDMIIYGENMYAVHSIYYNNLSSYFYVFNILRDRFSAEPYFVRFEELMDFIQHLRANLHVNIEWSPVLGETKFDSKLENDLINDIREDQEGFVVRNRDSFYLESFNKNVAKWVRANHVQTDQHWKDKPIQVNKVVKPMFYSS